MKLFNAFRCLFLSGMVLFMGANSFAQNVTVKGKVSDSNGEPIIGVTVMLNGNNTVGSLTDANGNYSITVPANSTLSFSCVGFATQEEQLNGRTTINVVLQEDTEFLDETVVIGYGTQKKRLLTGATINITGDEIQKQSTTNALGALYSSVPGVNIVQASGVPGAGYNITVRGIGTTGSASPLIVIDGVAGGNLDDLNPADIESIDILKDAASAAIYGARAANGVVLVTTRQGKIGEKKATVTFDAYTATPTRVSSSRTQTVSTVSLLPSIWILSSAPASRSSTTSKRRCPSRCSGSAKESGTVPTGSPSPSTRTPRPRTLWWA